MVNMSPAHHPADASKMILRSTVTSPYGRKVRMAAISLGIDDQVELIPADSLDPDDDLRIYNPLGKMPYLIVEQDILFDSRVILEYLDAMAGYDKLLPKGGIERFRLLTKSALADGIIDASLLIAYEARFREPEQLSQRWLDHQRGKLERGLSAMLRNPPNPEVTDVASISLACALGYLDWRKQIDWRAGYPGLVGWLDSFSTREPAFEQTRKPQ
jgi:glutathione S-transferase